MLTISGLASQVSQSLKSSYEYEGGGRLKFPSSSGSTIWIEREKTRNFQMVNGINPIIICLLTISPRSTSPALTPLVARMNTKISAAIIFWLLLQQFSLQFFHHLIVSTWSWCALKHWPGSILNTSRKPGKVPEIFSPFPPLLLRSRFSFKNY